MVHELYVYHGKPGKLPDLLHRFQTITLAIWQHFGARRSHAERKQKWTAFVNDLEWQGKRAEADRGAPTTPSVWARASPSSTPRFFSGRGHRTPETRPPPYRSHRRGAREFGQARERRR